MRYWLLPMMFKRQFVRYQFGKSEQGIDLYQDYFELYAAGRKQVVQYGDVQTFAKGKLTYMLELKIKRSLLYRNVPLLKLQIKLYLKIHSRSKLLELLAATIKEAS